MYEVTNILLNNPTSVLVTVSPLMITMSSKVQLNMYHILTVMCGNSTFPFLNDS